MGDILVSVVIITYNSSSTICETLDSVFSQSYNRLELIVSDDGSKDETVSIARKWIKDHSNRFERAEVLTTPINTGIPANCNRGIRTAKGDWIKLIAGDDLLANDCVKICVNYVNSHQECNLLFSEMNMFKVKNGNKIFSKINSVFDNAAYLDDFNNGDAHHQFYLLLRDGNFISAPTAFFKSSFIKNNPYPEEYKCQEDYPMWLRLTHKGYKLYQISDVTVYYRISSSLSHRESDYYSRNYMRTRSSFFWNECIDFFKEENLIDAYNRYRKLLLLYELTEAFTQNKINIWNSLKRRLLIFVVGRMCKYEL